MAKPAQPQLPQLDINLIPTSRGQGNLVILVHWLLTVGRYLIITTEAAALIIFALGIKFTLDKNDLKGNINEQKAAIDQLAETEANFRLYQTKIERIQNLKQSHSNLSEFYTGLLQLLPDDTSFDEIRLEGGRLTMAGSLKSPSSLQALIQAVNQSEKFENLDITNLTVPSATQPFYTFTASATLKPGVVKGGLDPIAAGAGATITPAAEPGGTP